MIGRGEGFIFAIDNSLVNPRQRFDTVGQFVKEFLLPFMPHHPGKAMQKLLKVGKKKKKSMLLSIPF